MINKSGTVSESRRNQNPGEMLENALEISAPITLPQFYLEAIWRRRLFSEIVFSHHK